MRPDTDLDACSSSLCTGSLAAMTASILYMHGFNSSPDSQKARQLLAAMQHLGLEEHLRLPALHHHPRQAIAQLETLIEELGQPTLVGSSLGGYYATYLAERHGLKAILINPAVRPHLMFDGNLVEMTNLHTGEQWQLTLDHIQALAELEVPPPTDGQRYTVWLQTGDETLDYRKAADFYKHCQVQIEEGGDHSFQGFAGHFPKLLRFAGFEAKYWQNIDFSAFN